MSICNRFHERMANNGKIMTFTGVPLFDAFMHTLPWTKKIETWTAKIYVQCWKFHTQLLYDYLNWFRRNSLLKCVSQPEIAKKSIKPLFGHSRSSKVIEFGGNWKPVYNFLLVINSNLGPTSHRYWDSDLMAKNRELFLPPSHLAPSFRVTPFEFKEKLYSFWNTNFPGSRWWRFGDPSLHHFWLIHLCDRQTDEQNCDG